MRWKKLSKENEKKDNSAKDNAKDSIEKIDTFSSTVSVNDTIGSASITGDAKVGSTEANPEIVEALSGKDVVEVETKTTVDEKVVSEKEDRIGLSTTDKKPTEKEVEEVKKSITDLKKDVETKVESEVKVSGLDPAKKEDKIISPAEQRMYGWKSGRNVYSEKPLVTVIAGEDYSDVIIDLTSVGKEFDSAIKQIDGFRVSGELYNYKYTETGCTISHVGNKFAKGVAEVLIKMSNTSAYKTE